jgi:ATP-binding cassette subfamily B protein
VDLRDLDPAGLRRRIGFVPQETFLFSSTLAANIAFGVDSAPPEAIRCAAGLAGLGEDLAGFPQGLDTVVGERGITLSGGQKQRAAIARALLRDPEILILDDALSSVDTLTEEKILRSLTGQAGQALSPASSGLDGVGQALSPASSGLDGVGQALSPASSGLNGLAGRTTILISHRVSTVRHASRIFVLEAGRVVEEGSHDELVARGGYYADLHSRQLIEEELETI